VHIKLLVLFTPIEAEINQARGAIRAINPIDLVAKAYAIIRHINLL
jgi:hypothetical protein